MTKVLRQRLTTMHKAALVGRLHDTLNWPDWAPVTTARILVEGDNGPSSPGEIRRFVSGKTIGEERVLPSSGDVVLAYELLSGLPLRNYRGQVQIEDHDGQRLVTWSSRFDPAFPLTGWIFALGLGAFFDRLLDGLVRA